MSPHPHTCLLTGATSGIGRAASLELARRGWNLILLGRHAGRGEALAAHLSRAFPQGRFEFLACDLADLRAVGAAAQTVLGSHSSLDSLVANAGARYDRFKASPDGFERTFAANHLGHFLLTALLWPALVAAPQPRVITVTSGAHRAAQPRLGWNSTAGAYDRRLAYAGSKLANLLFAEELARRSAGTSVVSVAFHPGVVATRFALNNGIWPWMRHVVSHALRRQLTPVATAGRHLADLADHAAPEAHGRLVRGNTFIQPGASALDPGLAADLWNSSLHWCRLPDFSPSASSGPFVITPPGD